jgi:hypothetical protein
VRLSIRRFAAEWKKGAPMRKRSAPDWVPDPKLR